MTKSVRVANAGGYWGDDHEALRRQVDGGPIDYLTIDYLAEVTMVLLQKAKAKDATTGYASDFVPAVLGVLESLLARKIRVVTNAGGVHPEACAEAIVQAASRLGLAPKVAVVKGSAIDAMRWAPANADTGAPFSEIADRLESAYAYLGARPIVEALERGADVVITGRVADASLTLAPLVHEFGWRWDDWHRLAAGTVAGHLLECGAQATGGNLTDWKKVPRLEDVGYPVVEVFEDGGFVLTKHESTGGAVTRATALEQLLYEIGDPHAYATPDVTVDFTTIRLTDLGGDRVRVEGVRGVPPPPTLKACLSYHGGWKSSGSYLFGPPGAEEKAEAMGAIFWHRLGGSFEETLTERLGRGEVHLRLSVRDPERKKVELFARRFASLALSGPPGLALPGGGRPPVQEAFGFWPAAVPREAVAAVAWIDGERVEVPATAPETRPLSTPARDTVPTVPTLFPPGFTGPTRRVPLVLLAFARSGDKGDSSNIGVAARSEEAYELLRVALTPEFVRRVFAAECHGGVLRYELPNLLAFNFVLKEALGGGGLMSLRADPQGKAFAQRLLATEIEVPRSASVLGGDELLELPVVNPKEREL